MLRSVFRSTFVVLVILATTVTCSNDGGKDAAADAGTDASVDAATDAPTDGMKDAATDAGSDTQTDAAKPDAFSTTGFVSIPAGTFMMGSPASEPCRSSAETQHQVTLTHGFEISDHEVTQGEFQTVMGYNPANFSPCGTSCPVEKVSWYEAAAYCNALSTQKGLTACYTCSGSGASVTCAETSAYSGQKVYTCPGYRLPTEAEWEYAYRAGTTTAFYNGPNDSTKCTSCSDANATAIGWYDCNSGNTTHPVKQKLPNAWGLYDMVGNVYEWCHDWYQGSLGSSAVIDPVGSGSSSRVYRGGYWFSLPNYMRAAHRRSSTPAFHGYGLGFRYCRTK
jgi:formylglycine-generating enzyme required for sulfatase activity